MEERERKNGDKENHEQQKQHGDMPVSPEQRKQQQQNQNNSAQSEQQPATAGNERTLDPEPGTPASKSGPIKKTSSGGAGGGLASLARHLTDKAKEKKSRAATDTGRSNGSPSLHPHDDLPLGSEANSLPRGSLEEARDIRLNGRPDLRLIHGWQSFNSDASNHTTASSASLEMLLNTRQVDPEMMLRNLGFGGSTHQSILPSLERVPERFLDHPSQAYGIELPGFDEQGEELGVALNGAGNGGGGGALGPAGNNGSTSSGGAGGGAGGEGTPGTGRRKPKTGIWTVARTLSMFGNLNRQHPHPHHGHGSKSPVSGVPPGSVLTAANQMYLASQGFYLRHAGGGVKSGQDKTSAKSKPKHDSDKIQEEDESADVTQSGADSGKPTGSAASKRRMFQKTRSRQTWSLCDDSGDENGGQSGRGYGDGSKKHSTTSTNSDWITQSLDESLSREDSTGVDSKFAYFSTTTESSTESIDRNSDTEKAFEEIRQQYKDGQMGLLPKKERSSSEDLFFPRRSSGGEVGINGGGGRSVRFGDLSDDDDDDDNVDNVMTSGRGRSRRNNGGREGQVANEDNDNDVDNNVSRNEELDFLRASLDSCNTGVGGENGGGRYFISPANSRQATVEKAPSVVDHTYDNDEAKNNESSNIAVVEECISSENTNSLHASIGRDGSELGAAVPTAHSDVRIVVSNSTEILSDSSLAPPSSESSRLGVASPDVRIQRASSDSGSSSSGTAVGSGSAVTVTTDDMDTLRLSESENSITDRDSISRTNSPSGFLLPGSQSHSPTKPDVELVSCGVQTSSEDFAAAVEEQMVASSVKMEESSPFGDGRSSESSTKQTGRNNSSSSSNGFQLSTLPPAINPVALMRRLHNSQDELLPRMSSLQSDSSGFGDGEPGLDSGLVDGEVATDSRDSLVKVANLGSSSESNGTVASSVTTTIMTSQHASKGETATQTSVDESQYDTSTNQQDSSKPEDPSTSARYISHCIILQQAGRKTKNAPMTNSNNKDNEKDDNDNLIQTTKQQQDPSLQDYYYYQHQFCDENNEVDQESRRFHLPLSPRDYPALTPNGRAPGPQTSQSPYSTNQYPPDGPFYSQDPAPRGYVPSVPFQDHHYVHPHHHRPHHHRHHLHHHYSLDEDHHYSLEDPDPYHHPPNNANDKNHHNQHHHRHPHHNHHHHHHHHRRHHRRRSSKSSDELMDGFDDVDLRHPDPTHRGHASSRNQTPLSEELAKASSPFCLSSPSALTSPSTVAKSTSTPIGPQDNDSAAGNRVVSSVNVLVSADGTHRASSTTHTPRMKSESSNPNLGYPPLAGNVTGVHTEDSLHHTPRITPYANSKPPTGKKAPRQKSCDILDDDQDPMEQENRFFNRGSAQNNSKDTETFLPDFGEEDAANGSGMTRARNRLHQYPEFSPLPSPRHGYLDMVGSPDTSFPFNTSKQPPVTPMIFLPRDRRDQPPPPHHPHHPHSPHTGSLQSLHSLRHGRRSYPSPTPPLSQTWDDLEGGYSTMADSSSEFSIRSTPAVAMGRSTSGVLDSQKLARLVNRPSGLKTRKGRHSSYHPRRSFREWSVLSRRKRLMEEDRLLQHSIHKYRTEMSLMQAAFLSEYGKAFHEMAQEEREEVKEMEWLWAEVTGQISEMEDLVTSRVQSLHTGNDFHSLLSSLGVIDKTIDLLKEQIYQQQMSRGRDGEGGGSSVDDLEDFDEFDDDVVDVSSRDSILSAHSMMDWRRPQFRTGHRRLHSSASTSNLPSDVSFSLDEMKASLLQEMREEIKASTKKLEDSLAEKTQEVQELKTRLSLVSEAPPLPSSVAVGPGRPGSSSSPTSPSRRASTKVERRPRAWIARSRSRVVGDRVVRETDI